MEKEFVTYELALRMKELGFDEPCFAFYSKIYGLMTTSPTNKVNEFAGEVILPLYQQAFRWFRDKYDLYPSINIYNDKWLCVIKSTISNETEISGYIVATINNGHPTFETYEEAELKCLEKLIEIVESKTEK
jgi:hypothetical protein